MNKTFFKLTKEDIETVANDVGITDNKTIDKLFQLACDEFNIDDWYEYVSAFIYSKTGIG